LLTGAEANRAAAIVWPVACSTCSAAGVRGYFVISSLP
jgi:hypothetical protein